MKLEIERVEVFGVAMPLVMEFKNACPSKSVVKSATVKDFYDVKATIDMACTDLAA